MVRRLHGRIAAAVVAMATCLLAGIADAKVLASGMLTEAWTHNCAVLDATTDEGVPACPYGVRPVPTNPAICRYGPDGSGKWTIRSRPDGSLVLRAVLSGMENCDGQSLIAQASFSGVTDDCAGELCFVDVSISSPSTVVAGGAVVLVAPLPFSLGASVILRQGALPVRILNIGPGGLPYGPFASGIER